MSLNQEEHPEDYESSSSEDDEPQVPTSTCLRQLGRHQIERVILGMQHATHCRKLGTDCEFDLCWKMKYVIQHTRVCEKRRRQECAVCNQVIAIIVFHGIECREQQCRVPFCRNVKASKENLSSRFLVDLDHLTNIVIQALRDLPGEDEEGDEEEPAGLLASGECADLVALLD